jgi:hypothetical protein
LDGHGRGGATSHPQASIGPADAVSGSTGQCGLGGRRQWPIESAWVEFSGSPPATALENELQVVLANASQLGHSMFVGMEARCISISRANGDTSIRIRVPYTIKMMVRDTSGPLTRPGHVP